MNSSYLQTRYQEIWDKYENASFNQSTASHDLNLLDRGFVFQYDTDETECDILFIGMNPSLKREDGSWKEPYSKEVDNDEKTLPYFEAFRLISKTLQDKYEWTGKWTHLDLFAFRETNQKFITEELMNKKHPDGVSFLYDQVMIARERILHIKPKVIVASNALARMFMSKERGTYEGTDQEYGVWIDFLFEFDQNLGTDVIIKPEELQGTHVFFTSMLSGQRALDNGSKERLTWHIDRALKNHHHLPVFFNYRQENTNSGYESIQDFFISWALRCADPKYKEANPRIFQYSQRIVHALLKTTNENGTINIPSFQENTRYEIKEVKTWRQWKYIDLLAEILMVDENNEEKLIVLNIENKWYSILREQQLTDSKKRVEEHYGNHDKKPQIMNIALFADEEKKDQYFDLCIKHDFRFQSVGLLLSHNEPTQLMKTGNHLFDAYWLDGKMNFY